MAMLLFLHTLRNELFCINPFVVPLGSLLLADAAMQTPLMSTGRYVLSHSILQRLDLS